MRLIDADALESNGICFAVHSGAEFISLDSVRTAPTIDAVPVVRCKDCKHKYNPDSPDWLWCYFVDTAGDDSCSYGERKDGE